MYDSRELVYFHREYNSNDFQPLSNIEVELMLRNLKQTAAGCDGIPAWLLRSCSYELADIVAHIMNCSIGTGKVPSHWLKALVTPVPKVSKPARFSDYRPICHTPPQQNYREGYRSALAASCHTC